VRYRALVTAMLIASLCGCGEGKRSHNDVKAKQLSPEQAACLKRTDNSLVILAADTATLQVDAMLHQRSLIQVTLQERREREAICLEQAKCVFGTGELAFSIMFDSCLAIGESKEDSN
jgi:hypothetical protein